MISVLYVMIWRRYGGLIVTQYFNYEIIITNATPDFLTTALPDLNRLRSIKTMICDGCSPPREARRAELTELLEYIAEMIGDPGNGEAYLPIFTRVEAEIDALSQTESAIERARRVRREKGARAARS
ncbi:hypothetical protein [Pontivivens nitratireducens]|uniref:hypothetical protein n=1 Tax=Pontivivens nitratireducens TaxID=2758038 RepID=UPI001C8D961B|nr:hypothetical protein [Pontibrevibacter nitratireducens]